MLSTAEKGRTVASRIKGRPALVKRLRALLLAVHRFGRGRVHTPEDLCWTATLIDRLYAALDAAEPQRGPER